MKRVVVSFAFALFALFLLTTFAFAAEGDDDTTDTLPSETEETEETDEETSEEATGGPLKDKGPITVQTEPGNEVRVYAWIPNGDTQTLFELRQGLADEIGKYSTTFFSLSDDEVKYQVRVISGKNQVRDSTFEGFGSSDALFVDCQPQDCVMRIDTDWIPETFGDEETSESEQTEEGNSENLEVEEVSDEVEEISEDEDVVEETETAPVTGGVVVEETGGSAPILGFAIFTESDGSINWVGVGIVIAVLVLLIGGIIMFVHRKGSGGRKSGGGSVQMMAPASAKPAASGGGDVQERILAAEKRLEHEQEELKKLISSQSHPSEIKEQKEAVSDARDELKEHKDGS